MRQISLTARGLHPYDTRPMSRPGPHRADVVDTIAGAAGVAWQRHFKLEELARLQEAGALSGTEVDLNLRSAKREDHVELAGDLGGQLMLTCQRCLQPVRIELQESIVLRVVRDERHGEQQGDHEYVIADPARVDLRWLSEEQALLAMPLVPMHEPEDCPRGQSSLVSAQEDGRDIARSATQSPFANLRDLLKKS